MGSHLLSPLEAFSAQFSFTLYMSNAGIQTKKGFRWSCLLMCETHSELYNYTPFSLKLSCMSLWCCAQACMRARVRVASDGAQCLVHSEYKFYSWASPQLSTTFVCLEMAFISTAHKANAMKWVLRKFSNAIDLTMFSVQRTRKRKPKFK